MLLTRERVSAAANINRFNGWTNRPYSILEHMVIGARVMQIMSFGPTTIRAFALHDMEESEFTDMVTPMKAEYMTEQYRMDVAMWNQRLLRELDMDPRSFERDAVHQMDAIMLSAETQTVSTTEFRAFHSNEFAVDVAKDIITSRRYATPETSYNAFWAFVA